MKKFAVLLVAVFSALFFCACQPDDVSTVEYKIGVTEIIYPKQGGDNAFFVQTTAEVKATCTADWCIVSEESYSSDKIKKFKVTVSENNSTSIREADIIVTIGKDVTETIIVKQAATPLLLSVSEVSLDYKAQSFIIDVNAANDYDVKTDSYWIEVTSKEDDKVTFSAGRNISVAPRSSEIKFSASGSEIVVTVTQSASAEEAPAPDKTGMESDAKTLMKKMTLGINLGNTLEAIGGETAWGAPKTTEAMILYFKELGFNAVRIPCSWDQYLEDGDGYVVRDSWMNRVKEVVDYVVKNDMYAILNIHWDGGWLENGIPDGYDADVDAQQRSIWTQIAVNFRDYDEHLVFAGTNEPNVENASQMETLLKYEQTFIDAVRSTGGKNAYRVLVFQGPSTDIDKTEQVMNTLPTDKVEGRLAAEVHYYTPWTFCGLTEDASWGKMMYFWGDAQKDYATGAYKDRWDKNYNEAYVAKQMAKMKTKFWDKGIPVIIGEYSVCSTRNCNLGTDEENEKAKEGYAKSRAAFNACVVSESKANGCVPFYWHCQGDLIDRNTLKVTEQATYEAIIEAGKTQYPD